MEPFGNLMNAICWLSEVSNYEQKKNVTYDKLINLEFRDESYEEANIIKSDIGRVWYFFPDLEVDYIPKTVGYGKNGRIIFEN